MHQSLQGYKLRTKLHCFVRFSSSGNSHRYHCHQTLLHILYGQTISVCLFSLERRNRTEAASDKSNCNCDDIKCNAKKKTSRRLENCVSTVDWIYSAILWHFFFLFVFDKLLFIIIIVTFMRTFAQNARMSSIRHTLPAVVYILQHIDLPVENWIVCTIPALDLFCFRFFFSLFTEHIDLRHWQALSYPIIY